jgi:hypothetical protein
MSRSYTPPLKKRLINNGCRFVVDDNIKSRHTANAVLKQEGLPKYF